MDEFQFWVKVYGLKTYLTQIKIIYTKDKKRCLVNNGSHIY